MTSSPELSTKFKSARKDLDLTIEQVSRQTGIATEFIEQLEQKNLKDDADVYTVGKLRNLASHLGLSEDAVEEQYRRELSSKAGGGSRRSGRVKSPIVTSSVALQAAVALSLVAIVSYIFWQVFLLAGNPRLELVFPEENQTYATEEVEIVGNTNQGSDVTIDGQPVMVSDDGTFRYSVTLDDGVHTFNLEARSTLGRTTQLDRTIIIDTDTGD